jgi:transposase InsO family protein
VAAANDVWCTDFKGWFRTGDGRRCDPFTLSDAHSRYLLRCQAVARPDDEHVRPIFEAAFREHGLPLAIRSDNGPPFASPGAGGLSRLAVWWLKARHPAGADRCRQATAEWPSRAGSPHPQARDRGAAG